MRRDRLSANQREGDCHGGRRAEDKVGQGAGVADRRSHRRRRIRRGGGSAARAARRAQARAVQPATQLCRGAARGACRLDPRARAGPAAGASGRRPATPTRSSPASAAGARRNSPICTSVPVVVRALSDQEAVEIAIIENVQREDLNAIEEGEGYKLLMDGHGYTQEDLAKVIGKSRSHLANTLRLLKLPDSVQDLVRTGAVERRPCPAAGRTRRCRGARRSRGESRTIGAPGRGADAGAHRQSRSGRRARTPTPRPPSRSCTTRSGSTSRSAKARARRASSASAMRSLDQLEDVRHRLLRRPKH